ncbi:MAG: hypothetical protein ACOC9T_00235 [Myxococcota bacterium]
MVRDELVQLAGEATSLVARLQRLVGRGTRVLRRHWAELLLISSYTAGWTFMTWGVARLFAYFGDFGSAGVPEIWILSAGLYFLSLGGWGFLWEVAREGFYVLHRTRGRK